MNFLKTKTGIAVVLGVVVFLWIASSYNGFISARGGVDNAWSQVQTQYQRRFDLVPNLVSTVKGAAKFEQSTLTAVTEARTKWMDSGADRGQQIAAAEQFDSALSRLLVTVEAYPQLQATQAFRDLMTQLEGTENRISVARKDFNDAVLSFNVRVQRFPSMILARLFGFTAEPYFEAQEDAKTAPKVDFDAE
jgi:LemA protein